MSRVVITIPTFRRPAMLLDTLGAVSRLVTQHEVLVIVADNDAEAPEGQRAAEALAKTGYRFPLRSFAVTKRGHPAVRNALIAAALIDAPDFIILMDDDQLPAPDYLDRLVARALDDDADLVGPTVTAHFVDTPPAWARTSRAFCPHDPRHGPVQSLSGDGGILIRPRILSRLGAVWFDESFGLAGGADSELFERLQRLGARFSRAKDAEIAEVYVRSRVNLRWVLQRAFRMGNSAIRIQRMHGRIAPIEALKIPGATARGLLNLLFGLGQTGRQVDGLCQVARAAGKLMAILGMIHQDYRVIHGR